jgi:hypothetical protein
LQKAEKTATRYAAWQQPKRLPGRVSHVAEVDITTPRALPCWKLSAITFGRYMDGFPRFCQDLGFFFVNDICVVGAVSLENAI